MSRAEKTTQGRAPACGHTRQTINAMSAQNELMLKISTSRNQPG